MKKGIIGGIISAIIIFLGAFGVGQLNDFQALKLLQAMLPSTRFLCSSVITATSTILALILTLLSFSSRTEKNLRPEHYDRVKQIASFACITFIASVILLLFLTLPLEESKELQVWYEIIYYVVLVYSASLGGLLIAVMLMLYEAAKEMILIVHPDKDDSQLILSSKEKEEEQND